MISYLLILYILTEINAPISLMCVASIGVVLESFKLVMKEVTC